MLRTNCSCFQFIVKIIKLEAGMLVQSPLSRGPYKTKANLRYRRIATLTSMCCGVLFVLVILMINSKLMHIAGDASSLNAQERAQSNPPILSLAAGANVQNTKIDKMPVQMISGTPKSLGPRSEEGMTKFRQKQLEKQRQRGPKVWKNCSLIIDGFDLVDVVEPDESDNNNTNILCFIMTQARRQSRTKAVLDTWGRRCDHMLVASDTIDPSLGSIKMQTPATYEELFNKLNETLKYVWDTFYSSNSTSNNSTQYEWIIKADDDSYIILENLRAFLNSPEVQTKHRRGEPLIYGRIFAWPTFENLNRLPGYFSRRDTQNHDFGRRFLDKVNRSDTLKYHSGGAAYVMNKEYVRILLNTFQSHDTLRGIPDEDMAVGINMLYQGVHPQPTRDEHGLERFHPEPPDSMYHLYNATSKWLYDFHDLVGGIDYGPQCCSPTSISFHHLKPLVMRMMDYQLYKCQEERTERRKRFTIEPIPRKLNGGPRIHGR